MKSYEKIEIGRRFCYGIVIEKLNKKINGNQYWLLKCDCGNQYESTTGILNQNQKKSCGCFRHPSLVGQRFHKGVVLKESEKKRPNYKYWVLQCDCGNIYEAHTSKIKMGCVKSCGCHKKNRIGTTIVPGWYFAAIKARAKRKKKKFLVSVEYISEILQKQNFKCAISGLKIKFEFSAKNREISTASLDRIDSSKGYVEGNVQWVYWRINSMKNDMKQDEFINLCKIITENNGENNDGTRTGQ